MGSLTRKYKLLKSEALLNILEDLEEEKRKVEESEEKLRNIIDSSPFGMHLYNVENNKLIFSGCNSASNKILGINCFKFVGKTIEEAFPSLAKTEVPKRYMDAVKEGIPWRTEQINYKDKKISGAYEVNAFQISEGKMAVFFIDITKKKKAEQKLEKFSKELEIRVKERTAELEKANEELKELDVAKTEFLNTISHELKTPLTAMIAHLDILDDVKLRCISRGTEQKQCGLSFDAIRRSNAQLNFLIDNLLEVARMQSKTFKLDPTKFNVRELVLEAVGDFLPSATRKNLKIYYSVDKGIFLWADENRVREILDNLINNAIKFTKKGRITIRVKNEGDFISISVEDTGIGVKKEDMPKLFKKFFRVNGGLKRGIAGGTGLGLTIVSNLAQLHGGKVSAKSQFGKGSTFTVKLPVKNVVKKKLVIKRSVKGGEVK